jgi:hypothetical protein
MRRIITIPPEFLKESDAESCFAVGLEFERAGVEAQIRGSRHWNSGHIDMITKSDHIGLRFRKK